MLSSELHVFRGHQPSGTGFIAGHEFMGEVVETGSEVKSVQKGDKIVTPFTTSCGECFYCKRGFSSRCEKCQLFGTVILDGGQAEYCRIPLADSTVVKAPPKIEEVKLVLMADIFPTGYFAAANAFRGFDREVIEQSVVLLIGCGPVGLCALTCALDYKPKAVLAIDGVEARLEQAKKLGGEPWNYQKDMEGLKKRVLELSDGRGADICIELVGHSDALGMGFELLRPWGNSEFSLSRKAMLEMSNSLPCQQQCRLTGLRSFKHRCAQWRDSLDGEPGLWKKFEGPNGQMSGSKFV
jgi:threonine dehydrogenase-like Zn-dependent dehydrogenase